MPSPIFIGNNNNKYQANSSKLHLKMSMSRLEAPLLRPVISMKFSSYASIVRYGSGSVFIDELWYCDEMIARVTKTEPTSLELEVFNPLNNLRIAKLSCANKLLWKVYQTGRKSRAWHRDGDHTIFNVYPSGGQLRDFSAHNFLYKFLETPFIKNHYSLLAEQPIDNLQRDQIHVCKNLNFGLLILLKSPVFSIGPYSVSRKRFSRSVKFTMSVALTTYDRHVDFPPGGPRSGSFYSSRTDIPQSVYMYIGSIEIDGSPIKYRLSRSRLQENPALLPHPPLISCPTQRQGHG